MRALVVHAHPEPRAFGAALRDRAVAQLRADGHEVAISDLYAMGFDPVATERDFAVRRFEDRLFYDREQKHAVAHDALAPDIRAELDKVAACDLLVLSFPLWWFSVPAILKGWVDRVFVSGVAYGGGRRYDEGGFAGKRAIVCTTTNAWPGMVGERGMLGHVDAILWPIQNGILAYTGFDVLPPFVANAVAFVDDDARAEMLDAIAARMRDAGTTPPLDFHRVAEFGDDWRLRPEVEPRALGQRVDA